jgi:hypothetical protein
VPDVADPVVSVAKLMLTPLVLGTASDAANCAMRLPLSPSTTGTSPMEIADVSLSVMTPLP